jgi:dihydrofolate synthase/folylpolyglutamate synthase
VNPTTPPDLDTPYVRTLERLYGLVRFGEKFGLDGPRALDRALGGPVGAAPAILIGGTNGKGSTAAFVEALLRGRGLRTGLFTSPHLTSFRERIRIDGQDIAPSAVVRLADRVLAAAGTIGGEVPFFEVVWGMAALAFAEAAVDFVIWEVGLGGRLDATNVCEPVASAVVTVGLDHTAVLGPDLASIAREKAPIFRPGRPAFTAARGEALAALTSALPAGVDLRAIGRDFDVHAGPLPLPGAHQADNASVALALARAAGTNPDPRHLARARWPGRAEMAGPRLVLDCAHNPDGARALAAWLAGPLRPEAGRPVDLVLGAMADKDADGVLAALRPVVRHVTLVTPHHPRALDAGLWSARVVSTGGERPEVAADVTTALSQRDPEALTVVAGSCFLIGEVRAALAGQPYPEGGLLTRAR